MTMAPERSVPINTIKITEKAASKVTQFAADKGMDKFGLKVAVKGGGCSGLTYVLDIVDGAEAMIEADDWSVRWAGQLIVHHDVAVENPLRRQFSSHLLEGSRIEGS